MLNHTYTSVKNANLVDCGKKTHIASQPSSLLKENFLGEFRTELDKKKVLANLGIATDLSLEWEYIKGDIGRSSALMTELDSRTKYTSKVGSFKDKVISIIEGIQYLETIVGGEQEGEEEQNSRLKTLEDTFQELVNGLDEVNKYLKETIEIDINQLEKNLDEISKQVENINDLIKISSKSDNALILIPEDSDQLEEGETPGLYVPNLEPRVKAAEDRFTPIETNVASIQKELSNFVTKEDLGGDSFDFVESSEFNQYTSATNQSISDIRSELQKTVKTGEDGHVDTLFVNTISKNNDDDNIKITDSFEVTEGIPLDIRFVVSSRLDLAKLDVKTCYAGMGVIVKDESALYILREPENGKLTQEFIENVDVSWKCPEDLVTQALTREEFELLLEVDPETGKNKINPTKFYYVYEEDVDEPKKSDFTTDEAYQEAYQAWLKILHLEYMSAAWGVDIEKKVAQKANQSSIDVLGKSIKTLSDLIEALSGGEGVTSLASLSERIDATELDLAYLLGTEGTDTEASSEGKIVEIETSIQNLDKKIEETYVSIESITDESNLTDYIFVKKSDYDSDKKSYEDSIALSLTTALATITQLNSEQIESEVVKTNSVFIQDTEVTLKEDKLVFNNEPIALSKDVPVIEYLTLQQYEDKASSGDLLENVYYCTTSEETYITKTDFNKRNESVDATISILTKLVTELQSQITTLTQQINDMLEVLKSLNTETPDIENPEENLE